MQLLESIIDGHRAVINGIKLLWQHKILLLYVLLYTIFYENLFYVMRFKPVSFFIYAIVLLVCFVCCVFAKAIFYRKMLAELAGQPMSITQSFSFGKFLYSLLLLWGLISAAFFMLVKFFFMMYSAWWWRFTGIIFSVAFMVSFTFLLIILLNERISLLAALKRSIKLGWQHIFSLGTILAEIFVSGVVMSTILVIILRGIGYFSLSDIHVGDSLIINIFTGLCVGGLFFPAIGSLYQEIIRRERF